MFFVLLICLFFFYLKIKEYNICYSFKKKKSYIYLINCKTEKGFNKYYVGQTTQNPKKRFQQHLNSRSKIGIALRKTNPNNIEYKIIKKGYYSKKELDELEAKYIDKYNSYEFGYNETKGNIKSKNKK